MRVKQHVISSQQRHKQRHTFSPAKLSDAQRQLFRESERQHLAPVTLDERPHTVSRQLQRIWGTRESLLPIRELFVQNFFIQPLSLPHCVISVLYGQLLKRRSLGLTVGCLESSDFFEKDPHSPPVTHDVMHHCYQHVLVCGEPKQRDF